MYTNYLRSGQCWQDSKNNPPIKVTFGNQYTGYPGIEIPFLTYEEVFIVPCKNAQNGIALFYNPPGSFDQNTCGSLLAITKPKFFNAEYCSKDGNKTAFDTIDQRCIPKCTGHDIEKCGRLP